MLQHSVLLLLLIFGGLQDTVLAIPAQVPLDVVSRLTTRTCFCVASDANYTSFLSEPRLLYPPS